MPGTDRDGVRAVTPRPVPALAGQNKRHPHRQGAGEAVRDKPDRAPFEMALRPFNLAPGPEIWYVGDTALDMQAAHECGCVAVLLGDAAHDGGVKAIQNGNFAPHAHFIDGNIMAAWLKMLA